MRASWYQMVWGLNLQGNQRGWVGQDPEDEEEVRVMDMEADNEYL